MLHLILGSSSQAVAVGEALNWFRPVKTHHFEIECGCGLSDCSRWEYVREVRESQFHAGVAQRTGAQFVVDSSKEISWLIDARRWAWKSDMNCVNLFVWKDPLELAYSYWKRGGGLMLWRAEFLKYYKRVFASGLPLLTVNLGDLIDHPRSTVSTVAASVGVEYEERMERFWDQEHHHLFGSYGVRRQAQIGESFFKRLSFDGEFQVHVPDLKERIAADVEVSELIEKLRAFDVSQVTTNDLPNQYPAHPLPPFYYAQKLKRRLRRYRPQSSDHSLSHSVATIPVDDSDD